MSIDNKFSRAYLTDKGWILEGPEPDEIKVVAEVKVVQPFMNSHWRVSVLSRKEHVTGIELEALYQKYDSIPPGDLDW